MSRLVLIAVAVSFALSGCWSPVGELTASHVEAGGALKATIGAGAALTTKALADSTVDPMTIDGSSAELVFGLVVGTDILTGMPAKPLLLAGTTVQLSIAAGSQMSVHLGGQSCVASNAIINLKPDGAGNINGDFSGSGATCITSGTLVSIPIDLGQ